MVPFGANYKTSYIVEDKIFTNYPLSFKFTLAEHSNKAVGIYLNGVQLIAFHEYVFSELQYVEILTPLVNGDVIDMVFGTDLIMSHPKFGIKTIQVKANPDAYDQDYKYVDWVIIATPFTIYDNKTKERVQL